MNENSPQAGAARSTVRQRLIRDYAYVLPGLPIALFSFSLLLALTVTSIATLVIWVGALLLPLTLVVASGFAELSRNRLRLWGAAVAPVVYQRSGPGIGGKLRIILDPRRWLDLIFETLITFPLRLFTFVVALIWTVAGPAGITHFFWSLFVPDEGSFIQLIELSNPGLLPEDETSRYLIDAGIHFGLGVVFLVTLPPVMRGLAGLDAMLTTALLGDGGRGEVFGHTEEDPDTGVPRSRTVRSGPVASFSGRAWSLIGTGFASVVLLAVGWPVTAVIYSVNVALTMVLVAAHCAAVIITLRWVWPGLALSLAASAGLIWATAEAGVSVWPWPVTALITQCAVLAVAALAKPWYCAASGWCASAVLTLITLLLAAPEIPRGALSNGIVFASISAAVVIMGSLSRIWIVNVNRLEAAERTSAEQDRRRKELEERNRIARDLHDVVAHSMSVISVQAATAKYRHPEIGGTAQQEFEEIANSSRQALAEMRMLLGLLRGEDEVPTAPAPGLDDISDLVDSTRASGIEINYTGQPNLEASSAARLTTYRTVQEALSNALRHAPGAAIDVMMKAEGQTLHVSVINAVPPESDAEPAPGAGLGLAGIKERVEALGGSVTTGPTPQGGFAVQARIPLG